jgi:deoxycytidine triphosphate deaminase
MGIKPDHWIRRMALEHRMIDPFVERSVRSGVVSYGLSSYGYDIRVSNEFKIFTNVNSAIVDPKNFDPSSFVDFTGDVCIIPPNSFVLSRTVEYLRIPRDVLTICVGKCLTGDTRVIDATTGAYLPMSAFEGRARTLSLDRWRTTEARVSSFIPQGVKPVYELTTRLGLKIRATAEHPFRQILGWTPLIKLRPGDRIAVARHIPIFGTTPLPVWEAALLGLMISEGQCHTPGHSPAFTSGDEVLGQVVTECAREGLGCDVSHVGKFSYRLVNRRGRGGIMTGHRNRASRWLDSHGLRVKAADKFVPQAVFMAPEESVRIFLQALFSGDGSIQVCGESVHLEYYSMSRRLIEDVHHLLLRFGIVSCIREKLTQQKKWSYRIQITDLAQVAQFIATIGFWPGSAKQKKVEHQAAPFIGHHPHLKTNFDTLPMEAMPLMRAAATGVGASMRQLGVTSYSLKQSVSIPKAALLAGAAPASELNELVDHGPVWDVVERIEFVGEAEVYDLTVPGLSNFIANDIVVHNSTYARCGLIVNVTPLEPCFADDTEILTPEGWKRFEHIHLGERVLGMSDDGFAEYQPVLAKQVYDYSGELLHFDGRSVDLLVTPDHKLLVNRRTNGRSSRKGSEKTGWHTAAAKEIHGKHNYEVNRQVLWRGSGPGETVMVNGERYPTKAFLRFLGLWLGDGSVYSPQKSGKNSGYVVQIAAFKHKRSYVKAVLDELGVHYNEFKEGFRFHSKPLHDYLDPYKHAPNKHLPREWLCLGPDLIALILEGLMKSDGNDQTQTITTCSKQLADDAQVMAFMSGQSAIVRKASSELTSRQLNGVTIHTNHDIYKVRVGSTHMTPKIRPERHRTRHYSGKVYDVTVPNHLIFVRRNGKAVWSGNCWEGFLTLEISNTTPLPAKVYANEGIAQLIFLGGDGVCEQSYADKKGKYQGQTGVVLPKIEP